MADALKGPRITVCLILASGIFLAIANTWPSGVSSTRRSWFEHMHVQELAPQSQSFAGAVVQLPLSGIEKRWPPKDGGAWIYWVHVGKAGGISLRDGLPMGTGKHKSIKCVMNRTKEVSNNETTAAAALSLQKDWEECYTPDPDESALSKAILSHFHLWSVGFSQQQKDWVRDSSSTLLFNLRSPVSRIVSAFGYHFKESFGRENDPVKLRQMKRGMFTFYVKCFPTIEDLGQALIPNPHYNYTTHYNTSEALSETCIRVGKRTLRGEKDGGHFMCNYQHYFQLYDESRHQIVVIRTEHFWNDTTKLDLALGGDGNFKDGKLQHAHGSSATKSRRTLSHDASRAICCVIYEDVATYQNLILLAENLDAEEKRKTLHLVFSECGVDPDVVEDPVESPFSWHDWHKSTCPGE
jgi:hypothetical protein